MPVLSNILIKAENKQVTLSSTNLEIGLITQIGAKVDSEGSFTVPAKLLNDFVSQISGDRISFSLEGSVLNVQSDHFQASLHGIEADEFPENPVLKDEQNTLIEAAHLLENIPLVSYAAAADEARPVITGVLMLLDGGTMTLAAADGYRLAEKKIKLSEDSGQDGKRLIIPSRSLHELHRTLAAGEPDGVVEMRFDENQVIFHYKGAQLISRLLVGQYPDYKQIIPQSFKTELSVEKAALARAVKVAALFAKDSALVVHLEVKDKTLTIEASSSQVGENQNDIAVEKTGEDGKISLNARYILDFLSVVSGEKVVLKLNGALDPGVLSIEGDTGYTYVIMPIRT